MLEIPIDKGPVYSSCNILHTRQILASRNDTFRGLDRQISHTALMFNSCIICPTFFTTCCDIKGQTSHYVCRAVSSLLPFICT